MGGIISDLCDEATSGDLHDKKAVKAKKVLRPFCEDRIEEGVAIVSRRPPRPRETRTRQLHRQAVSRLPPCTRDHHRMCQQAGEQEQWVDERCRPLSFGERLERFHEPEDPSMVQRSSTPTGVRDIVSIDDTVDGIEEEDGEYTAWTSYLSTPGTFRGQLRPDLPGAFSGMCFPASDPRFICHHQGNRVNSIGVS